MENKLKKSPCLRVSVFLRLLGAPLRGCGLSALATSTSSRLVFKRRRHTLRTSHALREFLKSQTPLRLRGGTFLDEMLLSAKLYAGKKVLVCGTHGIT